jgi:hypothetical protein
MGPPLAKVKLVAVTTPPKNPPPATPTPPRTCKAPVLVDATLVVFVIKVIFVNVLIPPTNKPPPTPIPPRTCKAPVLVDATLVVFVIKVIFVNVLISPTNKPPPTPIPPVTTKAPVIVDPVGFLPKISTSPVLGFTVKLLVVNTLSTADEGVLLLSTNSGKQLAFTTVAVVFNLEFKNCEIRLITIFSTFFKIKILRFYF